MTTTTTATTTTVEIHIPIQEMEESTSTLHQLLPTTTTSDGNCNGNHNNTSTVINRIKSRFCSYITSPPPLKLRSMVSSSSMNKPIELDSIAQEHSTHSSDNDYPVLISDDEYYEFCNQMNIYIQQYDVIVNRRVRMEYYQNATYNISFLILIQFFVNEYSKMMNNDKMTILYFIFLYLRYIGYSLLVILINAMIYVCFTKIPLQNVIDEMSRMYMTINQLCADISFPNPIPPLPLSSRIVSSSSSSSLSSLIRTHHHVKVTFQMVWKAEKGMLGGNYSIMDSIKIIIVKTITTTTSCNNDSTTTNVTTGTCTTTAEQSSPTSATTSITTISEQGVSTTTTYTTTTATTTTVTTTTTQDGTIQHPNTCTAINENGDILYSNQCADSQFVAAIEKSSITNRQ